MRQHPLGIHAPQHRQHTLQGRWNGINLKQELYSTNMTLREDFQNCMQISYGFFRSGFFMELFEEEKKEKKNCVPYKGGSAKKSVSKLWKSGLPPPHMGLP